MCRLANVAATTVVPISTTPASGGQIFTEFGGREDAGTRSIVVLVRGTTSVPLSADRNDDRRNGDAHVSQVRRRQTTKALEGDYSQLEGDSLTHRKPVKLMQHWCDMVKLPCSGHDTRCCPGPATWNSLPVELRTSSLSSQTFAKKNSKVIYSAASAFV